MQSARRSAIPSRCSIAASSNIPASEVIRPPSKVKCTGLPATGGKPGRIPVPSSMAGANSVGFNWSGVATESYMEPIVYVAPASPLRQPDELSRLKANISQLSSFVRVLSSNPSLADSDDRNEADGVIV